MEKKYQAIIAGTVIFLIFILLGFNSFKNIENPSACNLCHEMKPYVASYLKPEQGSSISGHNLTCLGCHSSGGLAEAKSALIKEIEASALSKISGVPLPVTSPALAVNCTECHLTKDPLHPAASATSGCQDCHWAHMPKQVLGSTAEQLPFIPYGPHKNQNCKNCHGTTYELPRCINCHPGHGEQKLENRLCLICHSDPHVPIKPGIFSENTVTFTGELPFSVCAPCHENEYFNITATRSGHTDMQTCAICHRGHGQKPGCGQCHPGMMAERHKDFECKDCHLTFASQITCEDCHGRSHQWSAFTAELNPK